MQMQKRNAKQIEIKNKKYCKFKNANAESAFGHPLDSHLGVRDMQSWLPGFHAFRFASYAICARMSFSSVWVSVPASTLEWAHRFSGKG